MQRRLIVFVALLLGAVAAGAQPVGSVEIRTAPIAGFGGYAVGVDGTGFVYAWVENNRVLVTRLDSTLQNAPGAVPVAMPVFSAGSTLSGPAVATNGETIVVAWREAVPGGLVQNVYAGVAHDLSAILQAPKLLDFTVAAMSARHVAGRYVLVTQWAYQIDDQLAIVTSRPAGVVAAANDRGEVASAALIDDPDCHSGVFVFCNFIQVVTVTTPHGVTQVRYGGSSRTIGGSVELASNGDRFVAAWHDNLGVGVQPTWTFRDVDGVDAGSMWTVPTTTTDIGFVGNGRDIFAAWGTGTPPVASYVYGTILHADGSQTRFGPLAAAGQHPRVLSAPGNAFVLTYEIPTPDGTIVAGRVFRPAPSRSRAAR